MSIENTLVEEAYRRLLEREPESQAVLEMHARNAVSYEQFLLQITASEEYQNLVLMRGLRKLSFAPTQSVQVDVTDAVLIQLMDRVKREWQRLGENDPYWSVLSEERYRSKNLTGEELLDFLARGRHSAELINSFEALTGQTVPNGTCFELGCGVGRVR